MRIGGYISGLYKRERTRMSASKQDTIVAYQLEATIYVKLSQ